MMKKKDQLFEIIKKQKDLNIASFLQPADILNLSLLSKKYYTQFIATLESNRRDNQQNSKPVKTKTQKVKNSKAKTQTQSELVDHQVEIDKIPLHKFAKKQEKCQSSKWKRVEKLQVYNSYLNKKIQNKTAIFYKNEDTNQLIFINRSIVDPTLNYNKGGFGDSFINNSLYQHIFEDEKVSQQDFSSMEAILKRQKDILSKIQMKKEQQRKNSEISYEDELVKAIKMKRFGLILCFGGSFSFGIFENGRCVLHRSDKKYVCRQKAGERQFNKDKQSGSQIQSIGSQIRRDQQKKHVINVGQILKENNKQLKECEIIFLQAPGLNRLFVINQNQNLEGMQDKLRSVCVTAKKANFTEVEALFEIISQVHCVNYLTAEEVKAKTKQKK